MKSKSKWKRDPGEGEGEKERGVCVCVGGELRMVGNGHLLSRQAKVCKYSVCA